MGVSYFIILIEPGGSYSIFFLVETKAQRDEEPFAGVQNFSVGLTSAEQEYAGAYFGNARESPFQTRDCSRKIRKCPDTDFLTQHQRTRNTLILTCF